MPTKHQLADLQIKQWNEVKIHTKETPNFNFIILITLQPGGLNIVWISRAGCKNKRGRERTVWEDKLVW